MEKFDGDHDRPEKSRQKSSEGFGINATLKKVLNEQLRDLIVNLGTKVNGQLEKGQKSMEGQKHWSLLVGVACK
jgi:hypothetical protein